MSDFKKSMRAVSVRLPDDVDHALTAMARRRRMSRSAVVREALEKLAGRRRTSAADLAGYCIGCFEGPRDLSSSAKYWRGFGG